MKTIRFHFPFCFVLALALLLSSCHSKVEEKDIVNPDYKAAYSKGVAFDSMGQLDSAYVYYHKAKLSCSPPEVKRKASVLLLMSEIQRKFCDYSGSEENITEALQLIGNDTSYHSSVHNLLGIIYIETVDYDKAIASYKEVLKNTTQEGEKITALNNIAVVYLEQHQFLKATSLLEPLLKKVVLDANPSEKARVLDNLGYGYFKLRHPQALSFLDASLQIRQRLKNDYDLTASLMHLSEYYLNQNLPLSRDYALKAYAAATRVNNPDDRIEALDFLIKNATSTEYKKYYALHSRLTDSIGKVRQTAKNEFAKIKYDSKKLTQDLELQKTKNYLSIALMALISVLATVAIVWIRKRNQEKIKTISYETETRIAKKIHDELANDVFNVLTYAESQNLNDPNKKETLLDSLDTIYNQTRNISRENSEIKTDSQFGPQLTDLLLQYENDAVKVLIQEFSSMDWDEIKKETKIALYRVLQELMVNMKKHSECSFVILKFKNQKSHIEIEYKDNGKGTELLKSKKGLQNAENRIQALKGTITFDSEPHKGFKANVKIPK